MPKPRLLAFVARLLLGAGFMALTILIITNAWVFTSGSSRILDEEPHEPRSAAIVLGAGVRGRQQLSPALEARMRKAIELYRKGVAKKILLTGDGTEFYYNETEAMRSFAMREQVAERDLIIDPLGFSTYLSMLR